MPCCKHDHAAHSPRLVKEIEIAASRLRAGGSGAGFIFVAAGLGKIVLMPALMDAIGDKYKIIDAGSAFDGFAGSPTRDYTKNHREFWCSKYGDYMGKQCSGSG